MMTRVVLLVVFACLGSGAARAYPGGTPAFQTDAAPFCSGCHASRSEEMLSGAPGGRAAKELVENKHLALIRKGEGGYGELSEADRARLVEQIQALDEASTLALEVPATVAAGETFAVTVSVTGGGGPVVGIALVDGAHRWLSRPASSSGWQVVGPPEISGQDGKPQTQWLNRRPEALGRNLSFVNVTGISSDASKGQWGQAKVTFRLRAPERPGSYPLGACYWYGTEKGTPLGYVTDPVRGKQVRGGFTGHSGRVMLAPVRRIEVR
jgi:hypothetical protein